MRAKDGGALPDSECPTRRRYGNGEHARKHVRHGANASISNIASIRLRTPSRGYTFEACLIRGVQVRCGVVEVDILRT